MLPATVEDEEITSHFLHFSSQFKKDKVLFGAFFPPVNLKPSQLSVFRIDGLSETEIWGIGETHVGKKGDAAIKARADLKARHYRTQKLIISKDEPPPRHANVTGWPEPRPPFEGESKNSIARQAWQEMTTIFARNAKLKLKPNAERNPI